MDPASEAGTTRRQFVGQVGLLSGATLAAMTAALAGCDSSAKGKATPSPGGNRPAESIDRFLAETLPRGASLTALAARGEEIVYCEGIGMANRAARIRAGRDTVYDIGSITKQFTAAAILKLEMAGALATTDLMTKFVEGVPADKRGITLHQLLTHTAGLVDLLGDDYDVLSREGMLAAAKRSKLRSAPGSAYYYSNVGYSVLAAIIEKVSGVGYEEYLARHLFAPAGMTRTGYVLPRWDPADIAVEYDRKGIAKGRPNEHPWDTDGPYWNLRGNGGLLSTAPDMHRWHRALHGRRILSSAAKQKLFKQHVKEDGGTFYGYGWVIAIKDGRRIAWHNGGNGYSYAELTLLLDEERTVFWATNATEPDGKGNLEDLSLTEGIIAG